MGSKKHKKHHKSDKREVSCEGERQEKPLKLVLKVAGSSSSIQTPTHQNLAHSMSVGVSQENVRSSQSEHKADKEKSGSSHSHEKHKKSKKKKKKKSSEKDKERHEKKRKHHHHHHHHREHSHDRKEKRKREQLELNRSTLETHEAVTVLPKSVLMEPPSAMKMDKPYHDPRSCTLKKKNLKSPLQILLYCLLKKLQLKDPQEFFAWPVTDAIAPGYSSIIRNPTDFSTIKKKIDDRGFKSVPDFKAEIKRMCDNAMTYNRSDTIYYKSARKLWHAAQKMTSKEQLLSLRHSLNFLSDLTEDELGFDIREELEESLPGTEILSEPSTSSQPEAKKTKVTPSWSNLEADDDDDDDELSPEDILAVAQKAAKAAAEKLTLKKPNSKFGFLRQHDNGTTTLSILHPKADEHEVKVNLEMLTGKLNQGTGSIIGFKEDAKNIAKTVSYTGYGSYSSYAPHYDSMFCNLNKDESDRVLSTYCDDIGVQYADSIMSYAKNSDYLMTMVDNLLDVLTAGEHSKTVKILDERHRIEQEDELLKSLDCVPPNVTNEPKSTLQTSAEKLEAESMQALNDIDFEMSLLDSTEFESGVKRKADNKNEMMQKHKKLLTQRRAIQQKLDNATQLLQDLRKVQNERLSSTLPNHLAHVQNPTVAETELADKLTRKIADIALQLPPESVTSVDGLRKAMGISSKPEPLNKAIRKVTILDKPVVELGPNNTSSNQAEQSGSNNPAVSPYATRSPICATNTEEVPSSADMETDLQQFLETGPMLRVCESPSAT